MASIATLAVQLTARTGPFIKNIRKARIAVVGMGRVVRDAASRMSLFNVNALLAGASVGGLALLTRSAMVNIDTMAKVADKLGLTTQALGGLRFAALQTGVATNQLDLGIQRMTRRISEAAKDTGEAKAALKELGLDARRLASLTVDQQFSDIAEAMAKVTSQSNRIRLGFKLFDSEGVSLVNTLKLGSKGLAQMEADAIGLGIALTRIDARKVEQANDQFNILKQALVGVVNSFAVKISPMMAKASFDITEWGKDGVNAANNIRSGVDFAVGGFASLANGIKFVAKAWLVVNRAFLQAERFLQSTRKSIEPIAELLANIQAFRLTPGGIEFFPNKELTKVGKFFKDVGKKMKESVADAKAQESALTDFIDEFTEKIDALSKAKPGDAILNWVERANLQFDGLGKGVQGVIADVTALQKKIGDAKEVRFARTAIRDISTDALSIVLGRTGGAAKGEQRVNDPQLRETNEKLGVMVRQMRNFGLG